MMTEYSPLKQDNMRDYYGFLGVMPNVLKILIILII